MLRCDVPDLLIDDKWSSTLVMHATSAGLVSIRATVDPQENDPAPDNNTGLASIVIEAEKSTLTASGGGGASGVMLPILLLLWLARRRL